MIKRFALVIVSLLLFVLLFQGVDAAPPQVIDAQNCNFGCWRLQTITLRAATVGEIAVRAYDAGTAVPAGIEWHVASSTTSQTGYTKSGALWAKLPISQCSTTTNGPYSVWVGEAREQSDTLQGIGLPDCKPYIWELTWQWQPPTYTTYLPVVQ